MDLIISDPELRFALKEILQERIKREQIKHALEMVVGVSNEGILTAKLITIRNDIDLDLDFAFYADGEIKCEQKILRDLFDHYDQCNSSSQRIRSIVTSAPNSLSLGLHLAIWTNSKFGYITKELNEDGTQKSTLHGKISGNAYMISHEKENAKINEADLKKFSLFAKGSTSDTEDKRVFKNRATCDEKKILVIHGIRPNNEREEMLQLIKKSGGRVAIEISLFDFKNDGSEPEKINIFSQSLLFRIMIWTKLILFFKSLHPKNWQVAP